MTVYDFEAMLYELQYGEKTMGLTYKNELKIGDKIIMLQDIGVPYCLNVGDIGTIKEIDSVSYRVDFGNALHWMLKSERGNDYDEFLPLGEFELPEDEECKTDEMEAPKNNEGRDTCYWCKAPTKRVDTGLFSVYTVCSKCGK